jgi:hypothetical protein
VLCVVALAVLLYPLLPLLLSENTLYEYVTPEASPVLPIDVTFAPTVQ